jgi:hypothetical protein
MRTNEPVRSQWGIAFSGFVLVILLVLTVAIALVAVKVWALDVNVAPVSVKGLLPLGAALVLGGDLFFNAVILRSQVGGHLPRPRRGVLALGPPRSISVSLVLGCAGTWIFVVGVIVVFVDLLSRGKTPYMWVWLGVLALCTLAVWVGYVLLRMSRSRFVADGWGLRWENPFWPSAIQLPWKQIARIELRGSRLLSMRMVAITNDGRSRSVWVLDPSIPLAMASFRTIFEDIEGLRP